jgi:hypothetical protein
MEALPGKRRHGRRHAQTVSAGLSVFNALAPEKSLNIQSPHSSYFNTSNFF